MKRPHAPSLRKLSIVHDSARAVGIWASLCAMLLAVSVAAAPVTEGELGAWLGGGMADAELAANVRQRKVASPDAARMAERLRRRGAGPLLLGALADPANSLLAPANIQPPAPPKPQLQRLTFAETEALRRSTGEGSPQLPSRVPIFKQSAIPRSANWRPLGERWGRGLYTRAYARRGTGGTDHQRMVVGTHLAAPDAGGTSPGELLAALLGGDWEILSSTGAGADRVVSLRPKLTLSDPDRSRLAVVRELRLEGFLLFAIIVSHEPKITDFEYNKWSEVAKGFEPEWVDRESE